MLAKSVISTLSKTYGVGRQEITILLAHLLNSTYHELFFNQDVDVPEDVVDHLHECMKLLAFGEPISKIIQRKEFYGIDFRTNEYTLDPRPETELIIDLVKKHNKNASLEILDLGSGTGCIGLSLLTLYESAKCEFVDIDENALAVTIENANSLALSDRCKFTLSNWFENVSGTFDIITCNPPYVSTNFKLDNRTMFDPAIALFAGEDGMDAYHIILPKIKKFLNKGGMAFVEIGFDQRDKVLSIEHGLEVVSIENDINGIPRVIRVVA
ncbi:MAG: peptide chain release factor N(5)-glutamine methyltransferase [Holosporales bacterium]|jgi:release factor glutamine methyltransferase|nr:peptide chain release factor N(5)-glutamine methyltransferase [Holosporales bacterium]